MEPVKFVALDRDDLEVVSTHLQDAVVKVADVIWRPQEKRLVVALNRFDWLAADGTRPELRRCRSALRFERVNCCKCRNVDPAGKDAVLNLLAVEFSEDRSPRRRGDADRSPAAGRCGSRSSAWRPSWPISGPPGRRPQRPIQSHVATDARARPPAWRLSLPRCPPARSH